jgi:hypothetical protein
VKEKESFAAVKLEISFSDYSSPNVIISIKSIPSLKARFYILA